VADLKTMRTTASVEAFPDGILDAQRSADCVALAALMKKATKSKTQMWGVTIVGFGQRHCRHASGHEIDTFVRGFSPRKTALTLYLGCDLRHCRKWLDKPDKHKTGAGCLYRYARDNIDRECLTESLIRAAADIGQAKTAMDH